MGKNIIVAGAGHGGIIAGALLAEQGYEVTVYERKHRKELGYDWFDAINPDVFDEVGLPHLKEESFERNGDMLFFNPSLSAPMLVPSNGNGSAKLERKFIYNSIIKFAKSKGVKFVYGKTILAPIMEGLRVVGIETTSGKIFGDLVIDSCGINSPLRSNLPVACGIKKTYEYGDCFYGWRAYFNKIETEPAPQCDYEVYLVHDGEKGISWNVTEKDSVDVLIGKLEPFTEQRREEILADMRRHNPQLGTEIVRGGGDICQIPIANPLPVMVCDGYACIGDAAYMTLPMTGSGIVASMRAGKMLANTVIKDTDENYSVNTLWGYNYDYITQIGASFASIGILKNAMLALPPEAIDFLFEKQIITEADMTFGDGNNSSSRSAADIIGRVRRGIGKLPVLLKTASGLSKGGNSKDIYMSIPREYDRSKVDKWQKDVENAHIELPR